MKSILAMLTVFLVTQIAEASCSCQLEGTDCVVREDGKFVISTSASSWSNSCQEPCKPNGFLGKYCRSGVSGNPGAVPATSNPTFQLPEGYETATQETSLSNIPPDSYFILKQDMVFKAGEESFWVQRDPFYASTKHSSNRFEMMKSPFGNTIRREIKSGKVFKMESLSFAGVDGVVRLKSPDGKVEIKITCDALNDKAVLGTTSSNRHMPEIIRNSSSKYYFYPYHSYLDQWFDVYMPPAGIIK